MLLHDAIADVLQSTGRPMQPVEIAEQINLRGLYSRRDRERVPASQINARIRKHPELFIRTPDGVRQNTIPMPATSTLATQRNSIDHTLSTSQFGGASDNAADQLLPFEAFRSAADIDDDVPDLFGVYAIKIRDVRSLPPRYRDAASDRGTDLLYVGEAAGRTLRHRFLRNELRGRGHGTFFRSIGAVLGYRPPAGSLVGRANARNYRFSATDVTAIVSWINDHLDVSWVTLDAGVVHETEVALIRALRPLLNIRDNPAALRELSDVRALCRRLASYGSEVPSASPAHRDATWAGPISPTRRQRPSF
ncbi:GIY-YIG nuclease family protein [Microbacterium sp. NPDC059771]|uniref:GIY-YIG nuclease family protein n=1 Tax=Microbacterium sp. NPDC059771 TaxID=3346941 RepID=UPI0036514A49